MAEETYVWIISPGGTERLALTWVAEILVARGWMYKYGSEYQTTRISENGIVMVEEVIFDELALSAGVTSAGKLVEINELGAAGDFGLEVVSDNPVKLTYKASAKDDTPGIVEDDVLADHPGGGKRVFWPSIVPASKIWIYATAPAGGAGATVSAILNVW